METYFNDQGHEAVCCLRPRLVAAPVVFDSPHSGRLYPDKFRPSAPLASLRHAEDRFVDELFADAPRHGAVLIAARFARTFIDPNRQLSDLDVTMLDESWPKPVSPGPLTGRGVGLIFRRISDDVTIYNRRLSIAEVEDRIGNYWQPYHDTLAAALDTAHQRHGVVFHINCHSMLPVGDSRSPDPGSVRADFVLGDLDGQSCASEFTELVAAALRRMGYSVALNDPYKGAEIVKTHGRPAVGRNSLQIEINRRLYMNVDTLQKHDGFDSLRADLGRLAKALCDHAAARAEVPAAR